MNILLSNGTETATARVIAYTATDRRVPPLVARQVLARQVLARLGAVTAAYLDGELVTVERRGDGALAVGQAA